MNRRAMRWPCVGNFNEDNLIIGNKNGTQNTIPIKNMSVRLAACVGSSTGVYIPVETTECFSQEPK